MIDVITLTGGITQPPELRYTPQGQAVCQFNIAQSDSRKNESGNWEKTQSLYVPVNIWNDNRGEHPTPWAETASALGVGDQVAVTGKLITRQWEDRDGGKRSRIEMQAYRFYVLPQHGNSAQQPQQQVQNNAWNQQPSNTGGFGGNDDEPPF